MQEVKKPVSFKSCLVPNCKNTTKRTPEKVFFSFPRESESRKQWCKIIRRNYLSPISCVYCCEDHFNVEEDTANYMQHNVMKKNGVKVPLQLRKGIVPHKFECQNQNMSPLIRTEDIMTERRSLINNFFSEVGPINSNDLEICESPHIGDGKVNRATSSNGLCDDIELQFSKPQIEFCNILEMEPITVYNGELCDVHEAQPSTSQIDVSVQVNYKKKYRSKGVQANFMEKKNALQCAFPRSSISIETSKKTSITNSKAPSKRKLFTENPVDGTSTSPLSSVISLYFEQNLLDTSMVQDDLENEKDFKSLMRSTMLTAIEKEPKLLLGLPKRSYYLIKLLSENTPLPTIDILITLKKIKLNDDFSILALEFGYSSSTIRKIFCKSIPIISERMKFFIEWPTPSEVIKKLPAPFKAKYSNVISIIHCLEIQIEQPSDAVQQALTWSQDNNCNTLKYLISFTPDGMTNFISDGYGGGATDIMIVQESGYLEFLLPHKAVMAVQGFKDLSSLIEAQNCTLIRPAVLKFCPNRNEFNETKQTALTKHIKRIINRLSEFNMFLPHACVDHHLMHIINDVVIVACGLINFKLQDVLFME